MNARVHGGCGCEFSVELSGNNQSDISVELSETALDFETGWGVVATEGTGAIAAVCVLDLAEYLALVSRRSDTLYLIRG